MNSFFNCNSYSYFNSAAKKIPELQKELLYYQKSKNMMQYYKSPHKLCVMVPSAPNPTLKCSKDSHDSERQTTCPVAIRKPPLRFTCTSCCTEAISKAKVSEFKFKLHKPVHKKSTNACKHIINSLHGQDGERVKKNPDSRLRISVARSKLIKMITYGLLGAFSLEKKRSSGVTVTVYVESIDFKHNDTRSV